MTTKKNIKVIYYVDLDDDTKNCLCAVPCDKDVRNPDVVDMIAEQIKEVFEPTHSWMGEHSKELAKAIAHHEFANIFEYEFGVEEIPLIEC